MSTESKDVKPLDVLKIILAMTTALSFGLFLRAEIARSTEANLRERYDYATTTAIDRLKNHEESIQLLRETQQMVVTKLEVITDDISEMKADVKALVRNGH